MNPQRPFPLNTHMNTYRVADHRIRRLHRRAVLVEEDSAEQPDFLNGVVHSVERDPITDVVRVLDEQEDD
jgi:hypothetical protein